MRKTVMKTDTSTVNPLALTIRLIEEFRKLGPQSPVQHMQVFCEVARKPGITQEDLRERVGISQSSVSRALAGLSKTDRHSKPGLNLIVAKENPYDRRCKVIHLTHRGKLVARSLHEAYNSGIIEV